MARIRSIKPEFWSSEQIVECSPNARLLFIGLWTFSDDAGVHPASVARIKMEVFPGDAFTHDEIGRMIEELASAGLIERYKVSNGAYLRVTGWAQHQRIDQPTYRHPLPDGSTPTKGRRQVKEGNSPNVRGTLDERSQREWSGEESNKEESPIGDLSKPVLRASISKIDDCPHDEIVSLYHELLPSLRRVSIWTPARQKLLRSRWREESERQNPQWWHDYFLYVSKSDFLMGRVDGRGNKPFDADLEWLIRPTNFTKIIEGRYENAGPP